MIAALRKFSDQILGRGAAALTVPPLDGAWKPDNRLEEAAPGHSSPLPRGLMLRGAEVLWASGSQVLASGAVIEAAPGEITALTATPAGDLVYACEGFGLLQGGRQLADLPCITALAYDATGTLWIAVGSRENRLADWSRDFLEKRRTGQIWRLTPGSAPVLVADKLGFPNGLLPFEGGVICSESWEKRLVWVGPQGELRRLVEDLPGYPAGLAPSRRGGIWLALFAPRSPLLELVLRETRYRREMMAEVPPEYWIAPALSSGRSFLEPMQGGALKQMGVLKPWAPSRSAGLVVEMTAAFVPVQSLHSRAGGRRHGITSLAEAPDGLWLASTGGDEVFRAEVR